MIVTQKGNKLVIEVDLGEPRPSSSGKTEIVYTSGGFAATTAQVDGRPVKVSITATVPPKR